MKQLYLIFLLLNFSNLYSQSLSNLDAKYGIKKFKLGTSPNLYKTHMLEETQPGADLSSYFYKAVDVKDVFNHSVDYIRLLYYKNQLYSICIGFPKGDKNIKTDMKSKIEIIFGIETFNCIGTGCRPNNFLWAYNWIGNKTELYFGEDSDGWVTLIMESTIIKKLIANEGI